jgi:pimeloyl-ACP methyl ester carboxylesterase
VEEHGGDAGGDVVGLVHGLGASGRFWRRMVAHLPACRCLAPDLLGFGQSPWPDLAYTVEEHVDALEVALLGRGEAPIVLVGHSTGCVFALELAARRPERVRALLLFSPPFFTSTAAATAHFRAHCWARLLIDSPHFAWGLCQLFCQRRRFWRHVLPALLPLPHDVVEDGMRHSYASISRTFRTCLLEHRCDDAFERVREAGVPLSVVMPRGDVVVDTESLQALTSRFALDLEVLGEGEHLWPLHFPEIAARRVAQRLLPALALPGLPGGGALP